MVSRESWLIARQQLFRSTCQLGKFQICDNIDQACTPKASDHSAPGVLRVEWLGMLYDYVADLMCGLPDAWMIGLNMAPYILDGREIQRMHWLILVVVDLLFRFSTFKKCGYGRNLFHQTRIYDPFANFRTTFNDTFHSILGLQKPLYWGMIFGTLQMYVPNMRSKSD